MTQVPYAAVLLGVCFSSFFCKATGFLLKWVSTCVCTAALLRGRAQQWGHFAAVLFFSFFWKKVATGGSVVKNLSANAGDAGSIAGSESSPGFPNGNLLQYSCLENGQRSLVGYSPPGHKELDTTEWLSKEQLDFDFWACLGNILDLQCCVHLCGIAKWFSYTYVYVIFYMFSHSSWS